MNTNTLGNLATDERLRHLWNTTTDFLVHKGFNVLGALVILAAGVLFGRWLGNVLQRRLERTEMEPPVRSLLVRVTRLIILILTLAVAADQLGIPILPFVAGLSVAGIGVGLALQGVLANLVAGLVIIFVRPFRVGEFIEIVGSHGQVESVELFSTTLFHTDRSRVVIPNRKIVGEVLHNYGKLRQLDLRVSVSYEADVPRVLMVVREVLAQNRRVVKAPEAMVGATALAESFVTVSIRPWVSVADYLDAQAEINLAVLERFRAERIQIAYPQQEVRLVPARAA
jgi:small conductance mechanosensitive channel